MVAETLADYEGNDDYRVIGAYRSTYPCASLPQRLRSALAEARLEILEFAKANPAILTRPFGQDIFTKSGNPKRGDDWRNKNIFANKMKELGFDNYQDELATAFRDCIYQATRFGGTPGEEARDWALGLAYSSAGLFTVHVMNIYQPQRGLFTNMLDANLHHDALDRPNYRSANSAISKVIKKALGWRGDADQRDEFRAELIISFIEAERQEGALVRKTNRGLDFEKTCSTLLSKEHFIVRETPASGDFGADLIAEKDELSFVIQCKNLNKPVGVKAVQEAIGARRHYTADFACVCADSGFTDAAMELASSNKVITTSSANLARSLASAY